MWRLVQLLFVAIFSSACSGPATPHTESHKESRSDPLTQAPDPVRGIVLVTIDTLRADALGFAGGPVETPNLDSLATAGWAFDRAISASMLTNPSHASIMTSLFPRDHSVYDNESGIADGTHTLAAQLSQEGWKTAAIIGFPHLNPEVSNLGQGFDVVTRATRKERRASETTQLALEYLEKLAPDDRFFLWLHYTDPHAPYDPIEPVAADAVRDERPMSLAIKASPGFQKNNPWFKKAFRRYKHVGDLTARYFQEVHETDRALELLTKWITNRDDVAIAVTSDHGENLGHRDLFFHHGGLYDAAVHVPLIIYAPQRPSRRVDTLVSTLDLAPTLLSLAGVGAWAPMRGLDLSAAPPADRPIYSEHMLKQLIAVRLEADTLIRHRASSGQFPTYLLEKGTSEYLSVSRDRERLKELDGSLENYLRAGLGRPPRAPLFQDHESLSALGYVDPDEPSERP